MKLAFTILFCVIAFIPSLSVAQITTCPLITSYLTLGTRSSQVIALKKYLASEKILIGVQNTNYFGPSTGAALKKWQKKKGIEPTGATGPKTRAALKVCKVVAVVTVPSKIAIPAQPKSSIADVQPTTVPVMTGGGGGTTAPMCIPETQTRVQSCPTGETGSITETRSSVCPELNWSVWVETGRACITITPTPSAQKSCPFNGVMIAHQNSVTAYEKTTIPSGQTCKSEVRACSDGVLNGSYSASSCSVDAAPEMSLKSNVQSVQKGGSVTLTWNSTYAGGCGLYRGASTLLNSDMRGVITIPNLLDSETFSLWCRAVASDSNSAVVQRVGIIVTDVTYKMSDYWPTVQSGVNLIRHYDSWLTQVLYKEQSLPYTYNIADYVFDTTHPNGALESLWRIRIDTNTGRVDEIGDYCPSGNYSGDCTWYNPELPIIWGTTLAIGQTISAPYGVGYESLTLQGHYDSIELGGVTYTDVIKLRVNQRYGANNAVGVDLDYFFQKNFGTIRTVLVNDMLHPEKNGTMWTLTKSCATSTPGQITCP